MKKILAVWTILITSCTPTAPLTSARWAGEGKKPQVDLGESTLYAQPTWKASGEDVQIFQQRIANFRVAGSFLKTVSKKEKGLVFQSLALVPKVSPLKVLHAEHLDQKKDLSWQEFLSRQPEFKNKQLIKPLEVVFVTKPKLLPVFEAVTEEKSGEIFSTLFDQKGKLISSTRMGSNLSELNDSPSLAFPRGPKKSELSNILLKRKIQPEGLTNTNVEIRSVAPSKIVGSQSLEFQPNDERFDDIQAFYFSNLILQWLKDNLIFDGPYKLVITTHLGFPEKTNAAFYFQNEIRLGTGDNQTFSNIPWDPSIVMHETSHAVIDALSQLPFQGEGGSINEGYADLFTTFYADNPLLAENSFQKGPFKRRVDTPVKLSEKNGGLYHDSAIISSFFWNLKKLIGNEKALQLSVQVLNRLGPNSDFKDFVLNLKEQSATMTLEIDRNKTEQLMKEHELL